MKPDVWPNIGGSQEGRSTPQHRRHHRSSPLCTIMCDILWAGLYAMRAVTTVMLSSYLRRLSAASRACSGGFHEIENYGVHNVTYRILREQPWSRWQVCNSWVFCEIQPHARSEIPIAKPKIVSGG